MSQSFAHVIGPLARLLLGEPNKQLSSKTEWRYGTHGSLCIDLEKDTWFDHEHDIGGGALDFVSYVKGWPDRAECYAFMVENDIVEDDRAPVRSNGGGGGHFNIVKTYDYTDEAGDMLSQVCRMDPKDFRQRKPNGHGGWSWSVKGVRQVPYRLPELLEALGNEQTIWIVEGEKDVDRLWSVGVPATTNAGGAKKWKPALNSFFKDAHVVIVADNDEAGQEHARHVAAQLSTVTHDIRVLYMHDLWPDCPPKGDISDALNAGFTVEKLNARVRTLGEWTGSDEDNKPKVKPLIQSSGSFVKDFVPPDYLIDGVMQKRFLYAFTGKTGSGKTAVVLFIAASVALGRNIGDFQVEKGRVLYLAGENPDDVRMRWIAMSQQMDFDVNDIEVYFVCDRFKISDMRERIIEEMQRIGDVALVVVDTSAAYFEGDEVNSNTQQGDHARMMRTLIGLPGGPCVLVNCHPVKNASLDNLLPLGAGAFLNEIDGNLTCSIDNAAVEVHWQGKLRGPNFEPIAFEIVSGITHERLKNSKGGPIYTVIARYLTPVAKEDIERASETKADRLLAEVAKNGKASMRDYCQNLGMLSKSGKPQVSSLQGLIKKLIAARLISKEMNDYQITDKGKKRLGQDADVAESNVLPFKGPE